jgi:NADH:ubiquinone oxidoreductase subunit C
MTYQASLADMLRTFASGVEVQEVPDGRMPKPEDAQPAPPEGEAAAPGPEPATAPPVDGGSGRTLPSFEERPPLVEARLPADKLLDVTRKVKQRLGYEMLDCVTAVDFKDRVEMVYHFSKLGNPQWLVLKVDCDGANPQVPSLCGVYQSANLQEREVWDLMGVRFTGHPNLKRILLWEGFDGHPMRKSYTDRWIGRGLE